MDYSEAAKEFGRRGGKSRSPRKLLACRRNVAKAIKRLAEVRNAKRLMREAGEAQP